MSDMSNVCFSPRVYSLPCLSAFADTIEVIVLNAWHLPYGVTTVKMLLSVGSGMVFFSPLHFLKHRVQPSSWKASLFVTLLPIYHCWLCFCISQMNGAVLLITVMTGEHSKKKQEVRTTLIPPATLILDWQKPRSALCLCRKGHSHSCRSFSLSLSKHICGTVPGS